MAGLIFLRNPFPSEFLQWSWTGDKSGGLIDVQTIIAHELGHILGLAHIEGGSNIMNEYESWAGAASAARFGISHRAAGVEDMAALEKLYGPGSATFSETKKRVEGPIWQKWLNGRSYEDSVYINGLPISDARNESSITDGKVYKTQWFERAKYEYHPENQPPYDVLLGLLGTASAKGRQSETPFKPVPKPAMSAAYSEGYHFDMLGSTNYASTGLAGLAWFPETQHTLGDNSVGGQAIASFWNNLGGIPQFGFPLSQPFMERNKDDGKTYLVQYFERQRFEYHPENKGTRYEVLLGRLGAEQINAVALLHLLTPGQGDITNVAFSPDGRILASGSDQGYVSLWRVDDATLLYKASDVFGQKVVFSPNGLTLAVAGKYGDISLIEVANGKLLRRMNDYSRNVTSVAFTQDGQVLVTGSFDAKIRFWKVSDGTLLKTLEGHRSIVTGVKMSPDEQILASTSADKTIRLWRATDGAFLRSLEGHSDEVSSLAFSPDGQYPCYWITRQ